MRLPRTVEDIDDLVARATDKGDPRGHAERLRRLAEQMPPGPGGLRAEALVAVGELWQLAGEAERALQAVLEAQADGGQVRLGVRAHVAMARAAAGDADGARAELAALMRDQSTSLDLHVFVGQRCVGYDLLPEALTWLTRGVLLAERRGEVGMRAVLLLMTRWEVRKLLGLPADDWDLAAQRMEQEFLSWLSSRQQGRGVTAVTTVNGPDAVIDLVSV
jgi:hypothetical protein